MWYGDIFNGKKNKKKENYPTQENWKRQMIRKIHLQFQISEFIDISKNFRELLAILGETSILVSVYDPKIDPGGKFRLQLYRYHCVYSRL